MTTALEPRRVVAPASKLSTLTWWAALVPVVLPVVVLYLLLGEPGAWPGGPTPGR